MFCIGGSSTDKTSAVLMPTLSHFGGTFFTVDISGDISQNVTRPDLLVFDPMDPDTVPYHVFAVVDRLTDPQQKQEQLEKLSYT